MVKNGTYSGLYSRFQARSPIRRFCLTKVVPSPSGVPYPTRQRVWASTPPKYCVLNKNTSVSLLLPAFPGIFIPMSSSSLPCSASHRTHPDDRCQQQVFGRQARMPFQVAIYSFANEYYAPLPMSIMLIGHRVLCSFANEHYATLPSNIYSCVPLILPTGFPPHKLKQ